MEITKAISLISECYKTNLIIYTILWASNFSSFHLSAILNTEACDYKLSCDWLFTMSTSCESKIVQNFQLSARLPRAGVASWEDSMEILLKGELQPEISLLHMKVLTLIKAKSNVSPWYVQCCSCTRRSKTKILTTRAPPSWIEFDVVTSHRQTRHLEYDLRLLISMFLRLLISCKSQKNSFESLK